MRFVPRSRIAPDPRRRWRDGAGDDMGGKAKVLPYGPQIDLNFAAGVYYGVGPGAPTSFLTTSRASVGTAVDSSGNWQTFAANVPRITNLGLLVEESRTNLFLNSQAPVTQTIAVVNGSVYTASVYGTATLTLSGAGSGTATQGSPRTFTASSTSLTVTVSGAGGSFQNAQVELGAPATSPIPTTSAAVTRAADAISLTNPPAFGGQLTIFAAGTPFTPTTANTAAALVATDPAGSNRVQVYRNATDGTAHLYVGPAGVTIAGAVWAQNAFGKIAAAVTQSAQTLAFNGATTAFANAAAFSGLTAVGIGEYPPNGGFQWDGTLRRIALWPTTALDPGALQQLTT